MSVRDRTCWSCRMLTRFATPSHYVLSASNVSSTSPNYGALPSNDYIFTSSVSTLPSSAISLDCLKPFVTELKNECSRPCTAS